VKIISWVWSFFSGGVSVIALFSVWAGLLAIIFAIIGIIRKRCKWYAPLLYIVIVFMCSGVFQGLLWLNHKIMMGDSVSTVLFWSAVGCGGLGCLVYSPQLIKELWKATNSYL